MNEKDVANNMGCCGRACKLCEQAAYCDGCHSHNPQMARSQTKDGCFQFICCRRKKLNGCWECDEFPCERDMFAGNSAMSLKTFVKCAQIEGIEQVGKFLFRNSLRGIVYRENCIYDQMNSEAEVMELLKTGRKPKMKG